MVAESPALITPAPVDAPVGGPACSTMPSAWSATPMPWATICPVVALATRATRLTCAVPSSAVTMLWPKQIGKNGRSIGPTATLHSVRLDPDDEVVELMVDGHHVAPYGGVTSENAGVLPDVLMPRIFPTAASCTSTMSVASANANAPTLPGSPSLT